MIMMDTQSIVYHAFLYETSYVRVELFVKGQELWKCFTIINDNLSEIILPSLFAWDVHSAMHCNEIQLFFPYTRAQLMCDAMKEVTSFQMVIDRLQSLFMKLQHEQIPSEILPILCDQKNLMVNDDGNWLLYGNPHLEILTRNLKPDPFAWQRLCAYHLKNAQTKFYRKYPIPSSFANTLAAFESEEVRSFHEVLTLLEACKTSYDDVTPILKPYKKWINYGVITLFIIMILCSLLFFAYEYQKQRQAYFNEIEQIGDVKVNANE